MKKSFTLAELIFVAAAVFMLAALALPALVTAQNTAAAVGCINKLKMQGSAINLYADDNNDYNISVNVYAAEQANNHLRNNYMGKNVLSGRVALMHNGYFGTKEVIRNPAEMTAARKKYYQCPDDTKVFNVHNDSYYLFYYTAQWVPFSYRFGKTDYARDLLNGIGDPGNIISADAGIYSMDVKENRIVHQGVTNALTLDGRVVTRNTDKAVKQISVIKALRKDFGGLDVR